MRHNQCVIWCVLAAVVSFGTAGGANAQERGFFSKPDKDAGAAKTAGMVLRCRGPITRVMDAGDEEVKTTTAVFGSNPGGGEGGQFDKIPVLTTTVTLTPDTCLDAHLSALVGSKQTYGGLSVSNLTLFQVTLARMPSGTPLRHMVGHYETPYGIPSPAVALEAERDVDMFAAHFFQKVGNGPHEVPAGTYRVDVWWAGAPPGAPGGAIGAAFVLKLYMK